MSEDPFGRRDDDDEPPAVPGGWLPPQPAGAGDEPERPSLWTSGGDAPERPVFEQPGAADRIPVPAAPGTGATAGERANSGNATAALVLGIVGLLICPFVCSVLAIVLGRRARREIDASGGRLGGRGNATAGIVLGWVGVGFALLFVVLVVVGAIALDTDSSSGDDDTLFSLALAALA